MLKLLEVTKCGKAKRLSFVAKYFDKTELWQASTLTSLFNEFRSIQKQVQSNNKILNALPKGLKTLIFKHYMHDF